MTSVCCIECKPKLSSEYAVEYEHDECYCIFDDIDYNASRYDSDYECPCEDTPWYPCTQCATLSYASYEASARLKRFICVVCNKADESCCYAGYAELRKITG